MCFPFVSMITKFLLISMLDTKSNIKLSLHPICFWNVDVMLSICDNWYFCLIYSIQIKWKGKYWRIVLIRYLWNWKLIYLEDQVKVQTYNFASVFSVKTHLLNCFPDRIVSAELWVTCWMFEDRKDPVWLSTAGFQVQYIEF